MFATRSLSLLVLIAASTTTNTLAFAPPSSLPQTVVAARQQSPLFSALEVVDENEETDPFEAYKPVPEQTTVVFKDSKIGSGYTVGELESQQLKIKYTATFLDPKPGSQFDQSESFICKTGASKILPGFEEGLKGMKVGGKRTIRIPPNKGYGDKWYKGTIPPNAHLQFECELISIAQTPQEEIMDKLNDFGIGRAIGITICVGYLAASPFL